MRDFPRFCCDLAQNSLGYPLMKLNYLLPTGFLMIATGIAVAVNFGEKPDTPKLPDVGWHIPADRKVNGLLGGNSGIFLMRRSELQVIACYDNKTYPKKHAERGPISLQDHNDPIQFRNMWIREVGEYAQQ